MTIEFNFSNLKNIYIATLHSPDKSMAFDVEWGKGRFLFMMFLSEEDQDARDTLFVYMRNTKKMRRLKMYGKHIDGNFKVYIDDILKAQFLKELHLDPNNGDFDFMTFLNGLNHKIPLEVSQAEKLNTIRGNRALFSKYVDEEKKTVLIGDMYVANGRPRDKTLRKLFLYTDSPYDEIEALIKKLKELNHTLKWTTEDEGKGAVSVNHIISLLDDKNET